MPHSVKCTNCGAILKSQNPIAAGKKIKCPKCAKPFVVEPEEEDEKEPEEEEAGADSADGVEEETEEEEKPRAKKPARASDDDDEEDDEDDGPKKKGKDDNKSKKKSSATMIIVIVVVLFFCCCGCSGGGWFLRGMLGLGELFSKKLIEDLDKKEKIADKARDKDGPKVVGPVPVFVDTAVKLTKDVLDDQKIATEKYQNQLVEVSGQILMINSNIQFTIRGEKNRGCNVSCVVPVGDEHFVKPLFKDLMVSVTGKVTSITPTDIRIENCKVTNLEPGRKPDLNPSVNVSADQLAQEIDNDRKNFAKKYAGQEVIVKGTVEEVLKLDKISTTVQLRTASKIRIFANFVPPDLVLAGKGNSITLSLRFDTLYLLNNDELRISAKLLAQEPGNPPSKTLKISAEGLGQELDKGLGILQTKYNGREAIITGFIEDTMKFGDSTTVVFRSKSKMKIHANVRLPEMPPTTKGMVIQLRVVFENTLVQDNMFRIRAYLIAK